MSERADLRMPWRAVEYFVLNCDGDRVATADTKGEAAFITLASTTMTRWWRHCGQWLTAGSRTQAARIATCGKQPARCWRRSENSHDRQFAGRARGGAGGCGAAVPAV